MNSKMGKLIAQLKWPVVILAMVAAIIIVFVMASSDNAAGTQLMMLLVTLGLLVAVLIVLSNIFKVFHELSENSAKLDRIADILEKDRVVLSQINQNTRLTETAKAIAFRDVDRQTLREAVFDKLQQKDFEATYEIIDEITHSTTYQGLAQELRSQADKYRSATDQERMNQIMAHIDKLLEDHQWTKASSLIERLIKAEPDSERAKAMRQKLADKKEERKKFLLNAWDDAIKRQTTDRSLEILRELDLYLTPNEGLALQEAARDVFRNKLHSLGVRFSMGVSERNWTMAVQTGEEIIRDFPNSRMAEEIRGKMDVLRQKTAPRI